LEQLLNDYVKQLKKITKPIVILLKFYVYSRKTSLDNGLKDDKLFLDTLKVLLESTIHEKQGIRKESGKAFQFMLRVGHTDYRRKASRASPASSTASTLFATSTSRTGSFSLKEPNILGIC
jgi:hypothetical protein